MESQFGSYVRKEIDLIDGALNGIGFSQFQQNMENDVYNDLESLKNDFNRTCNFLARTIGSETEIGLAILTIHQLFDDKIKGLAAVDIEQSSIELRNRIIELALIAEDLPDNFDEFKDDYFRYNAPRKLPIKPQPPKECVLDDFHIHRLQRLICHLETDEELGEVTNRILLYEFDPGDTNSFEVSLENSLPASLQVIWSYLKSIKKI